ncbi:hypothetical protein ACLOJK_013176 [Asimina triloba]
MSGKITTVTVVRSGKYECRDEWWWLGRMGAAGSELSEIVARKICHGPRCGRSIAYHGSYRGRCCHCYDDRSLDGSAATAEVTVAGVAVAVDEEEGDRGAVDD